MSILFWNIEKVIEDCVPIRLISLFMNFATKTHFRIVFYQTGSCPDRVKSPIYGFLYAILT